MKGGDWPGAEADLGRLIQLHAYNTPVVEEIRAEKLELDGNLEGAALAREAFRQAQAEVDKAKAERATLITKASLVPHEFQPAALQPLVAALSKDKRVAAAWLAKRRLSHYPDRPYLVLAIRPSWFPLRWSERKYKQALARELVATLPFPEGCDTLVSVGSRSLTRTSPVAEIPGTKLYSRSSPVREP
jgi:hypothetical protein